MNNRFSSEYDARLALNRVGPEGCTLLPPPVVAPRDDVSSYIRAMLAGVRIISADGQDITADVCERYNVYKEQERAKIGAALSSMADYYAERNRLDDIRRSHG